MNFFTPEQPPGDSRRKVSDLCRLWCCGSLHGDYSLWKFDFSFSLSCISHLCIYLYKRGNRFHPGVEILVCGFQTFCDNSKM